MPGQWHRRRPIHHRVNPSGRQGETRGRKPAGQRPGPRHRRWIRRVGGTCIGECGGERGIRTLGAAINGTHDFQSCTFSQLGHLSALRPRTRKNLRANPIEDGGEGGIRTHDPACGRILLFESRAFSHSATSPSDVGPENPNASDKRFWNRCQSPNGQVDRTDTRGTVTGHPAEADPRPLELHSAF